MDFSPFPTSSVVVVVTDIYFIFLFFLIAVCCAVSTPFCGLVLCAHRVFHVSDVSI